MEKEFVCTQCYYLGPAGQIEEKAAEVKRKRNLIELQKTNPLGLGMLKGGLLMKKVAVLLLVFLIIAAVSEKAYAVNVQADFSKATCDVVDSQTIRISHISNIVIDGTTAPGQYWADFGWSPSTAGFNLTGTASAEPQPTGSDFISITRASCNFIAPAYDKCVAVVEVEGNLCRTSEDVSFAVHSPFATETFIPNPLVTPEGQPPVEYPCTSWTWPGVTYETFLVDYSDSYGCNNVGLHQWCADNGSDCSILFSLRNDLTEGSDCGGTDYWNKCNLAEAVWPMTCN